MGLRGGLGVWMLSSYELVTVKQVDMHNYKSS